MFKIFFIIFIFFPNYAFAYLDPGSANIILTFIVTIIAAISAFFSNLKIKILNLFKPKNKQKSKEK